ncbi:FAD:protein FMN transferase [Hoeflea sp.]|uniref:FAD:protein FMN transferase n=1 Tax=Hoeflea sp. TaxID=1940281 RepID=UPI003B02B762
MTLVGVGRDDASPVFAAVETEIRRLEAIFSLYWPGSEITRLNTAGQLETASMEFVELLGLCDVLHEATGGTFDPTVQPLWALHAARSASGDVATRYEIAAARERCGWPHVSRHDRSVSFDRPHMAITLNGIAQGYITDKIAALLRSFDLHDIAIDIGEVAALGRSPSGMPWRAGISAPDGTVIKEVSLSGRALATSAPFGTLLDRAGKLGHILDPRSGLPGGLWQVVSVSAQTAALSDGLSTAFCLNTRDEIDSIVAKLPGVKLEYLA